MGDVGAWTGHAGALLAALDAAVHRGGARPATRGTLGPLIDALGWIHALEPGRLEAALAVVDEQRDALTSLVLHERSARALNAALRLVDLAAREPRGPALAVLALLGDARVWTLPLEAPDLGPFAARLRNPRKDELVVPPDRPAERSGRPRRGAHDPARAPQERLAALARRLTAVGAGV